MAVISGDKFVDLVIHNPTASLALLRRLVGIVRFSDKRINDFSLLKAEQRVCIELLRLAEPDPGNLQELIIHPMPTQSNIANSVGLARETVGRIFSRLARQNIIQRQEKTLHLRERKTLEQMALF
jgi:CRP-like cAMP-binding protein